MEQPVVKILYHDKELKRIKQYGNFIDLRASKDYHLEFGEYALIDLGISIKLPKGYWAQLVPRSSSFKNYGFILTNSFGVIDNDFCGENDRWKLSVLCLSKKGTNIKKNDRICQFRIVKDHDFVCEEVDHLDDKERGGFGHTGKE